MEELINNALKIGMKANRIALIDSSIYLDPTDNFLNGFDSVNIIKGDPFVKQSKKIISKDIKEAEDNGTK